MRDVGVNLPAAAGRDAIGRQIGRDLETAGAGDGGYRMRPAAGKDDLAGGNRGRPAYPAAPVREIVPWNTVRPPLPEMELLTARLSDRSKTIRPSLVTEPAPNVPDVPPAPIWSVVPAAICVAA